MDRQDNSQYNQSNQGNSPRTPLMHPVGYPYNFMPPAYPYFTTPYHPHHGFPSAMMSHIPFSADQKFSLPPEQTQTPLPDPKHPMFRDPNYAIMVTPEQKYSMPISPMQNVQYKNEPLQHNRSPTEEMENRISPLLNNSQRKPKKAVPDSEKNEKYTEKRIKNNLAAKKSRETRKSMDTQNEIKLKDLEKQRDQIKNELNDYQTKLNIAKAEVEKLNMELLKQNAYHTSLDGRLPNGYGMMPTSK